MIAELKATPGPWSAHEDEWWRIQGADVASDIDVCAVANPEDWPVGASDEGTEAALEECEANANLIASAPCLYAALAKAAESIERMVERKQAVEPTAMALWANVAHQARAALAKARGEK